MPLDTDNFNQINVWDNTAPIEKSAYIKEQEPVFMNINKLKVPDNSLTMIDLFCGAGGFSVGCSWSGFFPVLGIDYLEPTIATWGKNHPNSVSCLGDIRRADPTKIKIMLENKGVKHINLITGGVPCQGFSLANRKHNDNDIRNFLFLEYMKFVQVFWPDYIILENISGLRSTAKGQFEREIKISMENLGYSIAVKIVNAVEYGVQQLRQRLIFVGVKTDMGLKTTYEFPKGKFSSPDLYRTVEDAISDLPELGNNENISEYTQSAISEYQKLMRGDGEIAIPKSEKLLNHCSPNHSREIIERIDSTPQGQPMYPKFKQRIRLSSNTSSPTQLAGGIRPQFQFGHSTQPRGLSIRERARIQSFPDSYEFIGGIAQERVLTGNAVPPLLVYELVKPIAEDIHKNSRKTTNFS